MDKNCCFKLREDEVGFAREMSRVYAEAKTSRMEGLTNDELGRGIFPLYSGHHARSRHSINNINQYEPHSGYGAP